MSHNVSRMKIKAKKNDKLAFTRLSWKDYLPGSGGGTYLLEAAPNRLSSARQSMECGFLAKTDMQDTAYQWNRDKTEPGVQESHKV